MPYLRRICWSCNGHPSPPHLRLLPCKVCEGKGHTVHFQPEAHVQRHTDDPEAQLDDKHRFTRGE
jgi:DnaJ-class molecular chaperone